MVEQIDSVLQQGDWDGAMYFVTMGISGDPYLNLSQYFGTGGSANFGGYSSPRVDDFKNQLGVAGEAAARTELSCSASQVILDELPIIPLIYPSFDFGVSRKVTGFDQPHPFAWYFMDHRIGKD
jgi:ABC-type transport system substrate-binding protein